MSAGKARQARAGDRKARHRHRRSMPWLLGLFLASWLVTVVVIWPLETVTGWMKPPPGASITAVEGSLWNGRATLLWPDRPPIDVHMRFRPASLLGLTAEWRLTARSVDGIILKADIRPRFPISTGATIPQLDAQIGAGSHWLDDLLPLPIDGRLQMTGRDLSWADTLDSGFLQLRWPEATLDLAHRVALGHLVADIEFDHGMLAAQIRSDSETAPGSLRTDLLVEGPVGGPLDLTGHLDPAGDDELTRQLQLLGSPQPDGRILIRQRLAAP